jgi:hypothetical protein
VRRLVLLPLQLPPALRGPSLLAGRQPLLQLLPTEQQLLAVAAQGIQALEPERPGCLLAAKPDAAGAPRCRRRSGCHCCWEVRGCHRRCLLHLNNVQSIAAVGGKAGSWVCSGAIAGGTPAR